MLLASIGVAALVIALCFVCFGSVGIPAAVGIFLGSYVGLGLLAFLFLWAATSLVDQEVPQEHDSRFYRRIVKAYIPAIWSLLGMKVDIQGGEQLPKEGRFLLVCNHLGILDPVVLLGAFPKAQLAFVSKKENSHMFIIGNLMHKIMCQKIDRENDREALKHRRAQGQAAVHRTVHGAELLQSRGQAGCPLLSRFAPRCSRG